MIAVYAPKKPGEPFTRVGPVFLRPESAERRFSTLQNAELRQYPQNVILKIRSQGITLAP